MQEYEERQKLSEDQKLSRPWSKAGLRFLEVGHFFCTLPSPGGEANQSLCREKALPRDQKGTEIKGWIQSNVRFDTVSDVKICNTHGRYSIEVQVQSRKNESRIRIANGIDKFVREAMPIQEEEKASGRPAAKARPKLKPSPTSGGDSTLMNTDNGLTLKYRNQRILIVFKCQNSLFDCFDTVNKFVEKKMVESIATKLLVNARRNYRRYRILVNRNEEALHPCPHWSLE